MGPGSPCGCQILGGVSGGLWHPRRGQGDAGGGAPVLTPPCPCYTKRFEPQPPLGLLVNFGRCTNIYWGLGADNPSTLPPGSVESNFGTVVWRARLPSRLFRVLIRQKFSLEAGVEQSPEAAGFCEDFSSLCLLSSRALRVPSPRHEKTKAAAGAAWCRPGSCQPLAGVRGRSPRWLLNRASSNYLRALCITPLFSSNLFFPALLTHPCRRPSELKLLRHREHEPVTRRDESAQGRLPGEEEARRTRTAPRHQHKRDRICRTNLPLLPCPPQARQGTKKRLTRGTGNVPAPGASRWVIWGSFFPRPCSI